MYQGKLIDVMDIENHGPIQRNFYKPHKSPPTPKKKSYVTSLLNPPSKPTQETNELHVHTISEYTDTDGSKKQFNYPYQLANGLKNELIVTDQIENVIN